MPPPFVPQARRSAWPIVIGIIYLLIAAWALWLLVSGLLQPVFKEMYSKFGASVVLPDWYYTAVAATGTIAGAAGICALIGSLQLLRRRPGAAIWMFAFAALFLIYGMASAVVQYKGISQMDVTAAMPPGQPKPPGFQPMMKSMMGAMSVFGAILGFLIHAAPAVFALIWFCRTKIRAEVESWKTT